MLQANEFFFCTGPVQAGIVAAARHYRLQWRPAGSGDQRKPAESRGRNCNL